MIIWSGFGFLVAAFVCGFSLLANLISNQVTPGYYDDHRWVFAVSLLLSAPCCWLVGQKLRNRKAQVVIDKETGKELTINRAYHAFFFIPMIWWAPILVGVAICIFCGEFVSW